MTPFRKAGLYLKLIWNHIVFWSFPTPGEDYYLRLGTIYFHLKKYRKAISKLKKSQRAHHYIDPSYSKYNWLYLGYCYLNLGNFAEATKYFENVLRFNNDPELLGYVSWCYMLINRPSDALEVCRRAAKLQPDASAWHMESARILMELSRKDEALEHLKLADTKTQVADGRKIIKSLEFKIEGRLDKAIETIKDVILNMDTNPRTLMLKQKANCYVMMSRYQRDANDLGGVLYSLEKALEFNPKDMWILNELAMEYADQKIKLDEALTLINKALVYQPENSIFMDTKGWILFKMGRKQEAKLEIEKSLALNPESKDTHEHYKLMTT
jgi:tetratricopeptide (TPR) repeat protein